MLRIPSFEATGLITVDAQLAARVSALFTRAGRYLPVMEGPRMTRHDADNEVIRLRNALLSAKVTKLLLGNLPDAATDEMRRGCKNCTVSNEYEDIVESLRGTVKRARHSLDWGATNLGVGLYNARLQRQELSIQQDLSPSTNFVQAGKHMLVAFERGNDLAEVVASNLAYSCNASFAVFPGLSDEDRKTWLEELYALGDGGNLSSRFADIAQRARTHLAGIEFSHFKRLTFVTGGFPWGIAVPERPTTHMYRSPNFGCAVVEGLWAGQSAERSARTALLIDPQTVEGSEVDTINQALQKNGTLTRMVKGPNASVSRVQALFDALPYDIIVVSTHAGDAPGERITYQYNDKECKVRRLIIDRVLGLGYDPSEDKFQVRAYHRLHSLDGVNWSDRAGKTELPVGSAIRAWVNLLDATDRGEHVVHTEPISRVAGSMAMQLHDGIWLVATHGFAPGAAPLVFNNACSSWYELSQRLTFAGARGYVGTLFPITDAEAQRIGCALFGTHIGKELPEALWLAQRDVYGDQDRRPYVMVGLPFTVIKPNTTDAVKFLDKAYIDGLSECTVKEAKSPHKDVRANAARRARFLVEDHQAFRRNLKMGPWGRS